MLNVDRFGARVLVVDDEAAIRDMLEYGLGQAGFAVRGVPDGRSALNAVRSWSPEIIVLDVMLPEIDGFTLLPALRQTTEVPIVILSARAETAEKVTGLSRGADDYLTKPFELEELVARLHSALRRPRPGDAADVHVRRSHRRRRAPQRLPRDATGRTLDPRVRSAVDLRSQSRARLHPLGVARPLSGASIARPHPTPSRAISPTCARRSTAVSPCA
jgi:DNA-binding response OmpR family regulator